MNGGCYSVWAHAVMERRHQRRVRERAKAYDQMGNREQVWILSLGRDHVLIQSSGLLEGRCSLEDHHKWKARGEGYGNLETRA